MEKKLSKIVGIKKSEFEEFVKKGDLRLREARLIPTYKLGDEMALTSVILTAIRLIKEFRKKILSEASMIGSGQIYVYTEAEFPKHEKCRADGLLIIVKGGTIRDAAIFEMKNGNDVFNKEQLERYQAISKEYAIPKIITVSNQFVSEPTQCPIVMKPVKDVGLIHFSWSYLLTIAHVLLFKNDTNIEDEDQVEIMHEIVRYLEDKKSGVFGFHQMKAGWSDVIEKINTGAILKSDDRDVCDAVVSWQQEEKDMALILSRYLGVLVESGERKYKGNLSARWSDDKDSLINRKMLSANLRVRDAVSDIRITGLLEKRTVEMFVSLKAPHDKTTRGQLGWIRRQLENCKKRNEEGFKKLQAKLYIDIRIKNSRTPLRMSIQNFDDIYEEVKDKELLEFKILYIRDFGRKFASPKKFVELMEQMLLDFYSIIIQHLSKWEPSAPKMVQPIEEEHPGPVAVTSLKSSGDNESNADNIQRENNLSSDKDVEHTSDHSGLVNSGDTKLDSD